jgi:hypothetical protein
MNKNIEIFYKFTKKHKPDFYQFMDGSVVFCSNTKCGACILNDLCKDPPVLTEEDFDYIKTENPEYMI